MNRHLGMAALALGLLAGCSPGGSPSGDAAAQHMEMRVYAVPPEQTDALGNTLNTVFATSGSVSIGKASSPVPGQLLVLAPANLHGSIEASLRALTNGGGPAAAAAAPKQFRLSFWSVDALPESGKDDLELEPLQGALGEARKQLGPVRFVLRDEVSAVSSAGQSVQRSWPGAKLTNDSGRPVQKLQYQLEDVAPAGLKLTLSNSDQVPVVLSRDGQNDVQYVNVGSNTTTAIRLGQTLVLARNPIPRDPVSTGETTVSNRTTRLYLVRVDDVPAG